MIKKSEKKIFPRPLEIIIQNVFSMYLFKLNKTINPKLFKIYKIFLLEFLV